MARSCCARACQPSSSSAQLLARRGTGSDGQAAASCRRRSSFALLLIDSVVLIALMVVTDARASARARGTLWLGDRPIRRARLVLGLALVPLVFLMVGLLLTGLMRLLPGLHNVTANPIEQLAAGGPQHAAMLGVIAMLAGGVREELQRAFLLRRFEQHLGGPVVGVIVLSIAFGLGTLPARVGCRDCDRRAGGGLGDRVSAAPEQRGADRESRRLQFARGIAGCPDGLMTSATSDRIRRSCSHWLTAPCTRVAAAR